MIVHNKIKIIDYQEQHASDFKAISMDWFESDFFKQHFTVEEIDLQVISNPSEYILKKRGHIFFAKLDNRIVGTVALISSEGDSFELSKLGVLKEYRGLKISNILIQAAINYSTEQGKKTIWLESIKILKPALTLFQKYGFKEIPLSPNSHYDRADIKMELKL